MCTRYNIQLGFKFLVFLKVFLFGLLLSLGIIFNVDTDLQRAYGKFSCSLDLPLTSALAFFNVGTVMAGHGGGLIIISMVIPISQYIGSRGSFQHNTFLLLAFAAIEGVLLAMAFSIANDVITIAKPEFPDALRNKCIQVPPLPMPSPNG